MLPTARTRTWLDRPVREGLAGVGAKPLRVLPQVRLQLGTQAGIELGRRHRLHNKLLERLPDAVGEATCGVAGTLQQPEAVQPRAQRLRPQLPTTLVVEPVELRAREVRIDAQEGERLAQRGGPRLQE